MATLYWVGDHNIDWSNGNGWSLSSGGAGGAGMPTANDDVVFDSGGTYCRAANGTDLTVRNLLIDSSYNSAASQIQLDYGNRRGLIVVTGTSAKFLGGDFVGSTSTQSGGSMPYRPGISIAPVSGVCEIEMDIENSQFSGVFNIMGDVKLLSDIAICGYVGVTNATLAVSSAATVDCNGYQMISNQLIIEDMSKVINASKGLGLTPGSGKRSGGSVQLGGANALINIKQNPTFPASVASTLNGSYENIDLLIDDTLPFLVTLQGSSPTKLKSLEWLSSNGGELLFQNNITFQFEEFKVRGSAGNLIFIRPQSNSSSNSAVLEKITPGLVDCDYIQVQRSGASPANTWYAGSNSVDVSQNTGWIFEDAPSFNPHISRRRLLK